MTVVYVDSVFFLNLILNFLLLSATARLSGTRMRRWRMILGSVLGALYAVAVYLPNMGFLRLFPIQIGVAVLMLLVSFSGAPRLLRLTLLFFGVAFAFGGGVLALELLGGRKPWQTGGILASASLKDLLFAAAVCYAILSIVFRQTAKHGGSLRDIVKITLHLDGRRIVLPALVDSGNTLTDPLTNAPVMVAEVDAARPLLPAPLRKLFTKERLRNPADVLEQAAKLGYERRFRLIPYQSVGVDCGLLLALRTEYGVIDGKTYPNLLVALSPTGLSDGGGYVALIGALQCAPFGAGRGKEGARRDETVFK